MKHTPTPWSLEGVYFSHYADEGGKDVRASIGSAVHQTDAAYIVRAVNMHEEFLKRFQLISESMNTAVDNDAHWTREQLRSHLFQVQSLVEETIAKAEGL